VAEVKNSLYEHIIRRPPVLKDNPKIIGEEKEKESERRIEVDPQKIVAKARIESQKILAEAEKKKEEVLEQLKAEKKKVSEELKRLKEEAQKEGYQVGYKEGVTKSQKRFDDAINDLLKVITEIQNSRESLLSSVKDEILHIIKIITQKVIKKDIEKDNDFIKRNLEAAVKLVGNKKKVTLRLNPIDFEIVDKDHIYALLSSVDQVEIRYDPALSRGDCILETSFGTIDARVDSQIDALFETLGEGE